MNRKKISIGLLLLVVAFTVVPGVMAATGTHPIGMAPPVDETGKAACISCHAATNAQLSDGSGPVTCSSCHADPIFTLKVTANPTTVTAGLSTNVAFTVAGSNNVGPTKTVAKGAAVTLSGAGVSATGTTDAAGIVALSVNPTSPGTINADATLTGFNKGTTTVAVNAPAPVLSQVTISPLNQIIVAGSSIQFTADVAGATLSWASSNAAAGSISGTGLFTSAITDSGTTKITVTATSGGITVTNSTNLTVNAPAPVLSRVTISPLNQIIVAGSSIQFTATPDVAGATLSWASSNAAAGSISGTGLFTSAITDSGTTKITVTATSGGVTVTNSTNLTVNAPAPGTGQTATVTFVITDNRTGLPVDDAEVSIDDITINTNITGNAVFTNVAPGTYSYEVSKDRYMDMEGSITVTGNTIVQVKLDLEDDENEQNVNEQDEQDVE